MKLSSKLVYAFISFILLTGLVFASRSFATPEDKVTICHGTDSVTNPYTSPTVDVSSATAEGHASHTGPVATSQAVAQTLKNTNTQWGDIIPPSPQSGVVGGLNWTAEGQAIYNNGCSYSSTGPTATPTPTPTPTPVDENKINICHRTDSVTNPYNFLNVDKSSADGNTGNDNGQGDHSEHTGPIATSQAVAQALKDAHDNWGDIIPQHDNYAGLNWTAVGQAMWRNSCNYVAEPTPTPTLTPTPTPTNCTENCGQSGGGSSNNSSSSSSSSTPTGSVLGASTMAGTGTFETSVMNLMLLAGMMVSGTGFLSYAKEKKARKTN